MPNDAEPVSSARPAGAVPEDDTLSASATGFYSADTLRPQQSIGWLMKRGVQSILLQADRALLQHELTHAQWLPLFRLAQGQACTVAGLAREQAQDPGAMTRALDRLEAKGLVRRERSATDRRVVQLVLTDDGHAVAGRVPPVLAQVLNHHLAGFSPAEFQQLLGLLQRVVANGDMLREPRDNPATPPADSPEPDAGSG